MNPSPLNVRAAFITLVSCGLALFAGGCSEQRVQAASPASTPVTAAAERPMNVAPDTSASPPETTPAPPPAVANPPSEPTEPVAIAPVKPAAPRKPGGEPVEEAGSQPSSAHPAAPQISPQISPGDQAAYERKTNEDVSVTERNLRQASGKQLSAAQRDLIEKIRSFISQSRDASKDGDWARAQNLAQKAHLLSNELVNSL